MSSFHNLIITISTKVFVLASAVVIQVLLASLLGVDDRGAYAVVFTYINTVSFLFLLGLDISIVYYISSEKIALSEGVSISILVILVLSVIATLFAFFLIKTNIAYFNKADLNDFYLGLFQIPFIMLSMVLLNIYTSVNDYKFYSAMIIANSIIQVILLYVLLSVLNYNVSGAILSTLASNVIVVMFLLYGLKKRHDFSFSFDLQKANIKSILLYGGKYYFGQISTILNFQIPIIFLGFVGSKTDIGLFSIASQLTARSMALSEAFLLVLLPKMSKAGNNKEKIISLAFKMVLILTSCFLFVVAYFAKEIIIFMFGAQYFGAILITQILCLGYILRSAGKVLESYLLGSNKAVIVTKSITFGLLASIVCMLVFPHYFPPRDAVAIAMVLSFASSTSIMLVYYKNSTGITYKEIFLFSMDDFLYLRNIFRRFTHKTTS